MTARATNIYDFDHTIYHGDASLDFIKHCLRRSPRLWKYMPRQAMALTRYILGFSKRKYVKQVAFAFLTDLTDLPATIEAFWQQHEHKIAPWYREQHRDNDIIISASPEFLLAPMAAQLGVRALIATQMDPHTGLINGQNCRGREKLRRLQAYDADVRIGDFYSDSLSDMPLLQLAARPYVVKKGIVMPLGDYKPSKLSHFKSPTFIRFLFVGGVNALLGVLFAYVISFFITNTLLAWVVGYLLSLVVSYPLNAVITFHHTKLSLRQFGSFCASYIPNFLVQLVCVHVLTRYLDLYRLFAYVLSVVIAVPVTFLLLSRFTFSGQTKRAVS